MPSLQTAYCMLGSIDLTLSHPCPAAQPRCLAPSCSQRVKRTNKQQQKKKEVRKMKLLLTMNFGKPKKNCKFFSVMRVLKIKEP